MKRFSFVLPGILFLVSCGGDGPGPVVANEELEITGNGERGGGIVVVVEGGVSRGGIPAQTEDWTLWWRHRGPALLDLGRVLRSPSTGSVADATSTGISPAEQVLEAAARNPGDQELAGPALLAFARAATRPAAVLEAAMPHLASRDKETASAAVLAIGIGGGVGAIPHLIHILTDDKEGRKLAGGRRKVDDRLRVDAAWALGIAGRRLPDSALTRGVTHALWIAVNEGDSKNDAVPAACVAALSMTRPPDPIHWAGLLIELAKDRRAEDGIRAQAPGAVARLLVEGDRPPGAVDQSVRAFLDVLDDRKVPIAVRLGMVEALGHLAEPGFKHGVQVGETLEHLAQRAKNRAERNFALLALGRFSSRGEGAVANRAFQHLMETVENGKSATKPWAALALGLLGREFSRAHGAIDVMAEEALRKGMLASRDAELQAAFALALGLCGPDSVETVPDIVKVTGKTRNPVLRGAGSLALGLIGSWDSQSTIEEWLGKSLKEPEALGDVAVGLALAGGDPRTALFSLLEPEKGRKPNRPVQEAILGALARIGHPATCARLLERAGDEKAAWPLRAAALDALGASSDPRGEDWSASWSSWFNYTGAGWPETLMDYEVRIRGEKAGIDPRPKNR
jgi:hypothetical protein